MDAIRIAVNAEMNAPGAQFLEAMKKIAKPI